MEQPTLLKVEVSLRSNKIRKKPEGTAGPSGRYSTCEKNCSLFFNLSGLNR